MSRHTRLRTAEHYAAESGYVLTPADWDAILTAQKQTRARHDALQSDQGSHALIQRFNKHYPRMLKALHGASEVMLTFSQTLIIAFGVPGVLVLLLIVEQERVQAGIGLFQGNTALASFGATALVILNLVSEFLIEHTETKAGYQVRMATRFSLRTWAKNAAYTLGISRDWTPVALSPAQRFRVLRRIITLSILALALGGSMQAAIAGTPGAWYEALYAVAVKSSLSQAATWAGGLAFAFAAVLSAQGLSRYVAERCVEILNSMTSVSASETDRLNSEIEAAAAQYVIARVNAWQESKSAISAVSETQKQLTQAKPLSPEKQEVVDWFGTHQDRLDASSHILAKETSFAQATIYRVQVGIKDGSIPFSTNGHAQPAEAQP